MSEKLLRHPRVALAPSDEGCLAYHSGTRQLHKLNPAATLIVELSDGTRTEGELCGQLSTLFAEGGGPSDGPIKEAAKRCTASRPDGGPDANNDAAEACSRWVASAMEHDLLIAVQPGVSLPPSPPASEFASLAEELWNEGYVLAAFVCQRHAALLAPDDSTHWYALGELGHIVGRVEEACEAYEKYLHLRPGDAEIEQILAGLGRALPPPRASNRCIEQIYSRFAEFYEETMCGELEYQAPARLTDALDAALAGVGGPFEVLELGCGTGLFGRQLRKYAGRLHAIDLSSHMVDRARQTGLYDDVEIAEITEWLARSDMPSFDLIAACDTLIYFGDLKQVLVPAARRIRSGGWLAFTVECGESIPFRLTASGRYVHSELHIREAAREAAFTVFSLSQGFLRYEYGEPVNGFVAVLRRM